MKIAIAGKGGTGKTTITTLLISYLSQENYILGIDSDSNENLAYSLGFKTEEIRGMKKIRHFMDFIYAHTKTDENWETRHITPKSDAGTFSFIDGVADNFLKSIIISSKKTSVAHLGTVDYDKRGIQSMCGSFGLLRVFLNHLRIGDNDYLILDLPAGNELLTRATIISMDHIILVVEPTMKNLNVAKDILVSLNSLEFKEITCIVNKSFTEDDTALVSRELNIPESSIYRVPFSQELLKMDNIGNLTFENSPEDIKNIIIDIGKQLKNIKSTDLTLERAKKIDERLFPSKHSKLTEEIHN